MCLTEGKADAALTASVFHYGTFRIQGSEGLSFKTRRRRAALKRGPFLITGEGPFLRLLQKPRVRA